MNDHYPDLDLHVAAHPFLVGAIVNHGQLSDVDCQWVRETAQAFQKLQIPLSKEFMAVAQDVDKDVRGLDYGYANLRGGVTYTREDMPQEGDGADYLKLRQKFRDIIVLCNIPSEDKLRQHQPTNADDALMMHHYRRAQKEVGIEGNLDVSNEHTAKNWTRRLGEDMPYAVAVMGGSDSFHASEITPPGYIALTGHGYSRGILIARDYLADLQLPVAALPLPRKDDIRGRPLPALVQLSLDVEKDPRTTSYSWDTYYRRFVPDGRGQPAPAPSR